MHPSPSTGDRVLVSKYIYDTVAQPERFDVVVFKYPVEPQKKHIPMNYIKRLCGKPGETVAIYYGDLYVTRDLTYEGRPRAEDDEQLRTQTYENDAAATELFNQLVQTRFAGPINGKKFDIVRKPPDKILAMRRLVNDNDFQPSDLVDFGRPRWSGSHDRGWDPDDRRQPRRFVHNSDGGNYDWLVYRHFLRSAVPELIN